MKSFLFIVLLALNFNSYSQLGGALGKAGSVVKKKTESEAQDFNTRRGNREKGGQSLEEKPNSSAPAPASSDSSRIELKDESSYSFSFTLSYNLISKAKDSSSLTYHFGENALMTIMAENTSSILDLKNERLIMIDEKYKSATSMGTGLMKGFATKAANSNDEWTMTKTGVKKEILTYSCEEIVATNEKGEKMIFFYTTEVKNSLNEKFAEYLTGKDYPKPKDMENGLMLELFSYNKKGKEEMHMIATKAIEESTKKNLSEYRVTKL
jgi:hypothetical protein